MTIDEMIAVLQAAKEGKTIQFHCKCSAFDTWFVVSGDPAWDFKTYDYRVKPEPMEIEVWVIEDDNYVEIARKYHDPSRYKGWEKKKFREVIE